MKALLYWQIVAYQNSFYNGTLQDAVSVSVYADSEQGAIAKAKQLIKRPHYRVQVVSEEIGPVTAKRMANALETQANDSVTG